MKQLLCLAAAATLAGALHLQAQSTVVQVSASSLWTNTRIAVTNGEAVTVNVSGSWNYASPVTPDGTYDWSTDLFLDNNIQGSVIAYVGDDPLQNNWGNSSFFPRTSGYWEIGSTAQFISNTNGYLWLGMNDDAWSCNTNDNSGFVTAVVFTGYGATNTLALHTGAPVLTNAQMSGATFSFDVLGNPDALWAVYASSDLINWVLIGTVTLDDGGYASFSNLTSVPYRFYKLDNGMTTSRAIGFTQVVVGPAPSRSVAGTNAFIANQLESLSGNTLATVFCHTTVPDLTVLDIGYNSYTNHSGVWTGSGDGLLPAGKGAVMLNPSSNAVVVTFVGLVPEGHLVNQIPASNWSNLGAPVPQAGGVESLLGYTPSEGDTIAKWVDSQWVMYMFYEGAWADPNTGYQVAEPVFKVGEGIDLSPVNETTCVRNFSVCK